MLQQVLEDEVTTWLGRDWNSRSDGEREGQRNGYGDVTIKTTAGPLELKRPKLRNTTERFASTLLGKGSDEPLARLAEEIVLSRDEAAVVRFGLDVVEHADRHGFGVMADSSPGAVRVDTPGIVRAGTA